MMAEINNDYATALFTLAKEESCEKEILESLETVLAAFEENPEYIDFLSSRNISKKERMEEVSNLLSGRVHEYVYSFILILCEREHITVFEDCVKEYINLYQISQNISTAKVTSVVPLTEDEKEKLLRKLEKLSGHLVNLECSLDESLIGGLVINMDGKIIDQSIRHRLSEVKEVMDK